MARAEGTNEEQKMLLVKRREEGQIQQSTTSDDFATVRQKSSWKPKARNLLACVSLWMAYLICNLAFSMIAPFFPQEAEEKKGFTPITTGVIISCSSLCVVILSPLFGYLLPHLGIRFMIFAGLLLIGGAYTLLGFVDRLPSNWVFVLFCVLLRVTEGIGSALFITATFTLLPVLYPKSTGTVTGIFEVGGGLGFAMGPPLGGLLYQYKGFMMPFLVVGIGVLLFIVPCTLLIQAKSNPKNKVSLPILFKVFTNLPFILLVLANILGLGALGFLTPTMQPFLSKQFDLNPFKVGLIFLIGAGIYMLCAVIIGPASDKLGGQRWYIVIGFILFGVAFFFIGPADFIAAPRLWITCVAFAASGVATACTLIPIYLDMLTIAKKQLDKTVAAGSVAAVTAVVSGVMSSSLSFGEFLGPLLGGALTEVLPFPTCAFLIGEVLMAEGFLLLGVTVIEKYTMPRTN